MRRFPDAGRIQSFRALEETLLRPAGVDKEEEEEAGWIEALRAAGEDAEHAEAALSDNVVVAATEEEPLQATVGEGMRGSVEAEFEVAVAEAPVAADVAAAEVAAADDASLGAAEQDEAVEEGFAVPIESWRGPQGPIERARASSRLFWQQPAAAAAGEKLIDVIMADDEE